MAFGRKTDEEHAAAAAMKVARQDAEKLERENAQRVKNEAAFWLSPQGRARIAFQRGDTILQSEFEVMAQQAVIVAMIGSSNTSIATDPTATLNSICSEGWDLITGSFVFIVQGEQSRDKLMSSGQNVAVKGITMGYYLFRRAAVNKVVA